MDIYTRIKELAKSRKISIAQLERSLDFSNGSIISQKIFGGIFMDIYTRIKELAKTRKISIAQLERNLDFSNGSISKWGKNAPSIDKLEKVADYFQVPIDDLIGREKKYWELTEKEKRDAAKEAEKLIRGLESDTDLEFYGEPMSEEAKAKFSAALKMALEMSKQEAKRKFTRKDYRD